MARGPQRALTPTQAKARFRVAAHRASLTGWTQEHPWSATLAAFVTGLTVGGVRRVGNRYSEWLFTLLPALFRYR
ncbi:MAG TPA: hypothetical protein ENK49_11190 [Gammaproteobacteria bacterium]|nr:hypothetical protein [Gammaproteobacteria bacterium]